MNFKEYLPFVNFTITTSLSPDEVQKRIFDRVQSARQFSFLKNDATSPYEGSVWNDGFEIQRIINYRSSFNPVICGQIYANGNKTEIDVIMKLPTFTKVFSILWLSTVGLACLGILIGGISHLKQILKSGFSPAILIPFGMFLFGCALVTIPFKLETRVSGKFLIELFEQEQ